MVMLASYASPAWEKLYYDSDKVLQSAAAEPQWQVCIADLAKTKPNTKKKHTRVCLVSITSVSCGYLLRTLKPDVGLLISYFRNKSTGSLDYKSAEMTCTRQIHYSFACGEMEILTEKSSVW